jgi:hypothetical protein
MVSGMPKYKLLPLVLLKPHVLLSSLKSIACLQCLRNQYKAERIALCGQAATKQTSCSRQHCSQHWFSQYVCCASNDEPLAIAHNTLQLAELLRVPCVLLLDSESMLPLQAAPWALHADLTAMTAAAAADDAASGVAAMEVTSDAEAPGTYSDDYSSLSLFVPKPTGNWHRTPCAALHLVLDIGSSDAFLAGSRPQVLQCCRCGNECGNKLTCGQHKVMRILLIATNGDIVMQMEHLTQLAEALGVQQVLVNDVLQDLQGKLQEGAATPAAVATRTTTAAGAPGPQTSDAAAAETSRSDRGQKRGADLADDIFLQHGSAKVAAGGHGPQATSAAAVVSSGPAVLRLQLTPDMAEEARQEAAIRQQNQLQTGIPWQDSYHLQQEAINRNLLQQGIMETKIEVAASSCAKQCCMGINLRLAVSTVQELATSRWVCGSGDRQGV